MPTVAPKTIIITGCGHGIGKDTAFALSARGHTVIATTETEHDAETLRTDAKKKNLQMEIYKLDITNPVDREKNTATLEH